jgi:hypothetical protein
VALVLSLSKYPRSERIKIGTRMKRIAGANADETDKKSAIISVARRAFVVFAFCKKYLNAHETDRCANADKN